MHDKRFIGWNEFEILSKKLFEKIPRDSLDMILAVGSGGLVLGKLAKDYFEKELAVIMAKRYKMGEYESGNKDVCFGEISSACKVEGKVLLIDDLFDEGVTMEKLILKMKKPGIETKTATLFVKPQSKIFPDYFLEQTSDWIVFPYEKYEFKKE